VRAAKNRSGFSFRLACCWEWWAVSLWLFFYLGAGIPYPNIAHARLMIEGFMASFIFGFLGTAGPRITSTPHFSLFEVAMIFTLDLLAAGAHTGGAHRFGDICFLLCLVLFARAMAKRFRQRKDSPPPNFVLVALGLLSGIAGATLVAYSETVCKSHSGFSLPQSRSSGSRPPSSIAMEGSKGFGGATHGRQRKLPKPSRQKISQQRCRSKPWHKKQPVNPKCCKACCQDKPHDQPCFQHSISWTLPLLRKTPRLN
jgi:NnrS protein